MATGRNFSVALSLLLNSAGFTSGLSNASRGLTQFQSNTNSFNSAISSVGKTLVGLFAVDKIKDFIVESIKLASVGEGIRSAFEKIGGMPYLEDLKKATRGTTDEITLMKNTVKASNMGLPIKDLANLFSFATARAAQTGESVDYLVESIVLGIGRKSPLILDNLGISAIALKEKLGGVSSEAASVGQVAEAVAKIAEESMLKFGETATTAAQKLQALNSS